MNAPIPTLDSWPKQTIRGHDLSGTRYTSREFMKQEWEGMWTRVWLLLGRESEIPNTGDWQMEPVGQEEVLMVRQQDQSIKAFYNVCQHRGIHWSMKPKAAIRGASCVATIAGRSDPTASCSSHQTKRTFRRATLAASFHCRSSDVSLLPGLSGSTWIPTAARYANIWVPYGMSGGHVK